MGVYFGDYFFGGGAGGMYLSGYSGAAVKHLHAHTHTPLLPSVVII